MQNLLLADLVGTNNCAETDLLLARLGIIKLKPKMVLATIEMPVRKQGPLLALQRLVDENDVGIYKIDNYRQNQCQTPQNQSKWNHQPAS